MNRRSFLRLSSAVAPAVILTPGLLMPVRTLWKPRPHPLSAYIDQLERLSNLIVNPPLVVQRHDMIGQPWQIYQLAKDVTTKVSWDFVQIMPYRPDARQMEMFKGIAEMAFRKAVKLG